MGWSSSGTVAGFTTQPVTESLDTAKWTLNLMFRADEAAGIVYVTGTWSCVAGNSTAYNRMNTNLLPAAFRPLAGVTLDSLAGGTAPLYIDPSGYIASATAPPVGGHTGKLRHFYFTTVTPA